MNINIEAEEKLKANQWATRICHLPHLLRETTIGGAPETRN